MPMQVRRTLTANNPPPAGSLAEGQLSVGLADAPPTLWAGVPTTIDPTGRILIAPPDLTDYVTQQDLQDAIVPIEQAAQQSYGRNFIDNPFFTVQQRGAGPWTVYANQAPFNLANIDRWSTTGGGGTVNHLARAIPQAERTQIGDDAASVCYQNTFTGGAAATDYFNVGQSIEGVRRLAGQTVTVSFWAQTPTAGGLNLRPVVESWFGTGGSTENFVMGDLMQIGAAWTRYQTTVAIPPVGASTVGTAGDDRTWLAFYLTHGAARATLGVGVQSGVIRIWGVQVELGDQATPLERPNPTQDVMRCLRFYEQTDVVVNGSDQATGNSRLTWFFKVRKRAVPTVTNTAAGMSAPTVGVDSARCQAAAAFASWGANSTASAEI